MKSVKSQSVSLDFQSKSRARKQLNKPEFIRNLDKTKYEFDEQSSENIETSISTKRTKRKTISKLRIEPEQSPPRKKRKFSSSQSLHKSSETSTKITVKSKSLHKSSDPEISEKEPETQQSIINLYIL